MKTICNVCPHKCKTDEGQNGLCYGRAGQTREIDPVASKQQEGSTIPVNYGHITSIALDPIEKKPLYHFHPGSQIVSVGSYGCNLKCPFCQNVEISLSDNRITRNGTNDRVKTVHYGDTDKRDACLAGLPQYEYMSPETLVSIAKEYVPYGNIGVAFTYNEPLICYEYVLDTSRLLKGEGLCAVVVTNGSVSPWVVDRIGPYIDAMNIDLKSFSHEYYKNILKGDLDNTKEFIRRALRYCHVELTTLVVSGEGKMLSENVSLSDMEAISSWIKEMEDESGRKIPYHISRFFPRSEYADRKPTDIGYIKKLYEIASQRLEYVYTGNC